MSAGLLSLLLTEARITGDVDVTSAEPANPWSKACQAAGEVEKELDPPEARLNDKCRTCARCLPLGWQE